ncbi:MAG TPA: metallophosphoesterase [Thermoanaerobaculia bacterium]|nr:metallophosphoesterase [Thermoanaerobaculia bacterium]HXT51091.1 metallophosphoesterase [Thermoanaerobaculia bacterium]
MRVAAVADLHCSRTSEGSFRPLLRAAREAADVLLLCGDLTDFGLPEEAHLLVGELSAAQGLPIVAVLGNHDYEGGKDQEVRKILSDAGVIVLDGDSCEVCGVGFAGVKGFCGGFGRGSLGAWGEPAIKAFVQEAVNEAIKLESALARLRTERRVVVMHYSPIAATVEGEPREIFPYLGSSRLEEPLSRYPVDVVFHGHAHRGQAEGRTHAGVPVFNVSLPLMRRSAPEGDARAFRLFEIPTRTGVAAAGRVPQEVTAPQVPAAQEAAH